MNRAMTINLTHTHMILIKLIVCCSGYLMHHDELHMTIENKL